METADDGGGRRKTHSASSSFASAVGLSLILHAGFFYALPTARGHQPPPTADTVFIELAPPHEATQSSSTPSNALAQAQEMAHDRDDETQPRPAPEPPPIPEDGNANRPATSQTNAGDHATNGRPTPEVTAALPLNATEPKVPPKATISATQERPRSAMNSSSVVPPRKQTKVLAELMPSSKELSSFRSGKLPDPAGGTAREASLGLGDTDSRYQGYVDQVRTGIYAGWHMGRGLIVAGSARRVVVGFNLTSLGMVENPQITESSGNPTLDAEAVEAVRRARLSPFPSHWTIERLYLYAVFDYNFR